jgi:hypothetical protein
MGPSEKGVFRLRISQEKEVHRIQVVTERRGLALAPEPRRLESRLNPLRFESRKLRGTLGWPLPLPAAETPTR